MRLIRQTGKAFAIQLKHPACRELKNKAAQGECNEHRAADRDPFRRRALTTAYTRVPQFTGI
jgi:hypothetical protein